MRKMASSQRKFVGLVFDDDENDVVVVVDDDEDVGVVGVVVQVELLSLCS